LQTKSISFTNGFSKLDLEISIHKIKKCINNVLIDTGFTNQFFGLKLPLEYAKFAQTLYTGQISLADASIKVIQYTNVIISKLLGCSLSTKLLVWTLFMEGIPIIGTTVLQKGKVCFDGPNSITSIEFEL